MGDLLHILCTGALKLKTAIIYRISYFIFNSPKTLLDTFWPHLDYLYSRFTPRCLLSLHYIHSQIHGSSTAGMTKKDQSPIQEKLRNFFGAFLAKHGTNGKKRKEVLKVLQRLEWNGTQTLTRKEFQDTFINVRFDI